MEQKDSNRMPIKAHPYEHQQRAYEFACRMFGLTGHDPPPSRGVALLMEMGTGKTLTTIAVAGRLYLNGKITRMLIVAPLSILGVWQEEFCKFADFPYSLAILNGAGSRKIENLRQIATSGLQVAVINYESAWRLERELAAWDADLIVCDEGHKIKTHNIAASKCIRICFRRCYDRYTQYRREHAIGGEFLEYAQFLKQLRQSDLFIAYKPVRINGELRRAYVLDYDEIKKRCDAASFDSTAPEPISPWE